MTVSECAQTIFSRRTAAKRKITNICKRFDQIKHVNDANQTVHDLRQNMTVTLARFQELDEKCISILEAAESGQREMTLTNVPSAKILPLLKNMLRRLTNLCSKQVDTLK